ncbi:6743_t:CDS:2 [Funneliformis geosporum]|uniref:14576_t:CDS:1 n=1 Tax=Funneliformis geosporum TaxID=1117311 RepID=A0A9W4SMU9_9GLOM|nr:6743_t:CDS:2 [Funneliformis geosporum]CAI2175200.1 14576_t:CDS:2 [Funneliformis geosporum]
MIFKSLYPNIEIPFQGIYQYITSNPNGIKDDKTIFIDGITGRKLTYGALKSYSKKFAAGLIDKADFKCGDVLAMYSPNQIDYLIILLGAIAAGGKVTPANPMYTVDEFTNQLKDSRAKYIAVSPPFLSKAIKAAAAANIPVSNIFLFGDKEIDGIKSYSSLISKREAIPIEYSSEEAKSTTAYLCYSSGTTGRSKGVETTHANMVANVHQIHNVEGVIDDESIYLSVLPFFHIYGLLFFVHLVILKGATIVIMPKFDLTTFCRIIQEYKINAIPVVPPIIVLLVKHPIARKYDLSSLNICLSGAAPLSKELAEEFNKMYNIQIKQGYGLTESPITHVSATDLVIHGSVGRLLPNMECKILSQGGEELGYNQPGELCIRGPTVMKSYLNNKAATDACIDPEGWLHTGDIATVDETGNFYIVERVKELIKYKGFQIPPAELESLLLTHPSIADAAVIGIYSNQEATEYPVAYVVLQQNIPKSDQLKEEIKGFIAQNVANYKKLRGGVLFIDQIPKSESGKILRRILRERIKTEHPLYKFPAHKL